MYVGSIVRTTFFKASSHPFRKDFGDRVDGADNGSSFGRALFVDFVDAIKLRDLCLTKMVFCERAFEVGLLSFRGYCVAPVGKKIQELAVLSG